MEAFRLLRVIHKTVVILLTLAIVGVVPTRANAASDCNRRDAGSLSCDDSNSRGPTNSAPGSRGGPSGPWYEYSYLYHWLDGDQWRFCEKKTSTQVKEIADRYNNDFARRVRLSIADGELRSACPAVDPVSISAVEVEAAIYEYWRQTANLPHPDVKVTPSRAVTGLPMYLEVEGDRDFQIDLPNRVAGVTINVRASSTYAVNWGDPADPAIFYTTAQGGPWRTSQLSHTYTQAGKVQITVTQLWRADWTAGVESGVVVGLQTVGTVPNLTIEQLEAVIRLPK